MDVEGVQDEKDLAEVKFIGENRAVANLIASQLFEDGVEFAGTREEHPLIPNTILVVKGKGALKSISKAVSEVKEQLAEAKKLAAKL